MRLTWGERAFIVWSGLKGAVPILLASLAVVGGTDYATEIYGIVFVVVLFSVVVQGSAGADRGDPPRSPDGTGAPRVGPGPRRPRAGRDYASYA